MIRTLKPEQTVVSRNGEVKLRHAKPGNRAALLGWVERDPSNPRRWLAFNFLGRRIGRRQHGTRAEALEVLTEQIDLGPVAAEEHKVSTGPIDIIPDDASKTLWSSMRGYERVSAVAAIPVFGVCVWLLTLVPSLP